MRTSTITTHDGHHLTVTGPERGDDPGEVTVCWLDGRLATREEARVFADAYLKRVPEAFPEVKP